MDICDFNLKVPLMSVGCLKLEKNEPIKASMFQNRYIQKTIKSTQKYTENY